MMRVICCTHRGRVRAVSHAGMKLREHMIEETGSGQEGTPVERLRRLGIRVTPQRLLVLEALTQGGHRTADEVQQWVATRYPGMNLATVYRTLDMLTEVGLVAQTDLGGGAASYELVGDSPHHHLICVTCGQMTEIGDETIGDLRTRLLATHGFQMRSRHLAIFGLCHVCRTAEDEPSTEPDGTEA